MVNKKHNDHPQEDIEITSEETPDMDLDLDAAEAQAKDIIKDLRAKLKSCESDKMTVMEETQRAKADFLNAKRRLEEEKVRDRERVKIGYIENLIPLCDSFQVAMANQEVWQKVDDTWRKGVEGIHAQLENLLTTYGVTKVNPLGEPFNPHQHEAISTKEVGDIKLHDTITTVVQMGYELTRADDTTELIRPARVIIGIHQ